MFNCFILSFLRVGQALATRSATPIKSAMTLQCRMRFDRTYIRARGAVKGAHRHGLLSVNGAGELYEAILQTRNLMKCAETVISRVLAPIHFTARSPP